MAEDSNLIASFQKNSQEEFRFSVTNFKGHEYADIRIFYEKDGDFFPSKKGITVSLDTWKDFKECFEKGDLVTTFVEKIVDVEPEDVYDFTTISKNENPNFLKS